MEVDFGDTELFEQLEEEPRPKQHLRFPDDEEEEEEAQPRGRLEESEETISLLKTENEELRRRLRFSSRPKGISVANSKFDGPLCHILFGNNSISKQCRGEIEDFVFEIIQKHQHQQNETQMSAFHTGPQNSSFIMEESQSSASSSKLLADAFRVVGSVLYFTTFCLDKLGQPLLNENPQLTEGWEIPKYQQVFAHVIALEGQEVQIKEKRPKACCFNCGGEDHQLRDCPKPKDMARINEKRKEFAQVNNMGNIPNGPRYHAEEVEERFAKYKPGVVSEGLLDALGVVPNMLPPYIYRMRELGYPPGWLKEAELEGSGLTLYDGKTSEEDNEQNPAENVSYDVSKLVDFPGFNVSMPSNVRDDFRSFSSIPMQPHHWKATFAAYLSENFLTHGSKGEKRTHQNEPTPVQSKRRRSNSDLDGNSDMDTNSDPETPKHSRTNSFQFQPPLPPGSPLISTPSTPPPLPLGTPPITSTPPPLPKGTPPMTPPAHLGSPALVSRGSTGGEESEDGLTLEELEERERLLRAELEIVDTGTSDSDTGATGTPGASTPLVTVSEGEEGEVLNQCDIPSTPASPVEESAAGDVQENNAASEDASNESCSELIVLDEVSQGSESDPGKNEEGKVPEEEVALVHVTEHEDEEPNVAKITSVPHRSKFAEGIVPFEETPEYTEVAEATGVYLRIRGLLKESPRNQAKIKKQTI